MGASKSIKTSLWGGIITRLVAPLSSAQGDGGRNKELLAQHAAHTKSVPAIAVAG